MTVEIFLRKIKSIRNELACDPYYKAKNEYITGLVDMADVAIRILEGEENETEDNIGTTIGSVRRWDGNN